MAAPRAADSALAADPVELVSPCPHPEAEELGLSGGVVFLRCLLCGDVLVVDRGREWSLRSDTGPANEELLEV